MGKTSLKFVLFKAQKHMPKIALAEVTSESIKVYWLK